MLTGSNRIQIENLIFFFDISILTCQRICKEEKKQRTNVILNRKLTTG